MLTLREIEKQKKKKGLVSVDPLNSPPLSLLPPPKCIPFSSSLPLSLPISIETEERDGMIEHLLLFFYEKKIPLSLEVLLASSQLDKKCILGGKFEKESTEFAILISLSFHLRREHDAYADLPDAVVPGNFPAKKRGVTFEYFLEITSV